MRYVLALTLLCTIAMGCHSRQPVAVMSPSPTGRCANLVLGPSPDAASEALRLAARSDWPAFERGYRFDDVTYFSTDTYEYQSGFDRFGGLYRASQSLRTGVWLP